MNPVIEAIDAGHVVEAIPAETPDEVPRCKADNFRWPCPSIQLARAKVRRA